MPHTHSKQLENNGSSIIGFPVILFKYKLWQVSVLLPFLYSLKASREGIYLKKNPSGNEQEDWIETETLRDSEHSLKATHQH